MPRRRDVCHQQQHAYLTSYRVVGCWRCRRRRLSWTSRAPSMSGTANAPRSACILRRHEVPYTFGLTRKRQQTKPSQEGGREGARERGSDTHTHIHTNRSYTDRSTQSDYCFDLKHWTGSDSQVSLRPAGLSARLACGVSARGLERRRPATTFTVQAAQAASASPPTVLQLPH